MVIRNPPTWIGGGHHQPSDDRTLLRDLARWNDGIVSARDLKVTASGDAATGVIIAPGTAYVVGRDDPDQGAYHVINTFGGDTLHIPATGPASRTDCIAIQIFDPDYGASADPDVDAARLVLLQGQADVPRESHGIQTATMIPLAKLVIPANTTVITAAMITDLRTVANPRRDRDLFFKYPTGIEDQNAGLTVWENFPAAAGWQLWVPYWATRLLAVVTISQIQVRDDNVNGEFRLRLGALAGNSIFYDENVGSDPYRTTYIISAAFAVPTSMQGTTQTLYVESRRSYAGASVTGNLRAATDTLLQVDREWMESPV